MKKEYSPLMSRLLHPLYIIYVLGYRSVLVDIYVVEFRQLFSVRPEPGPTGRPTLGLEGRSWFDKLTTNGSRTWYFKNDTNHDRTVCVLEGT